MKRLEVKCYAGFVPAAEGEKRYRVVYDENRNEIGIEVKGLLTKFSYRNENGMIFEKQSYDKVVSEYFEKNALNIPVDTMHRRDIQNLAGIVKELRKTDEGIFIVVYIPKGVYYYGLIKTLIDNGILQGFSNYGWIEDYNITPDDNLQVFEFRLISASLVDIPADTNTEFVSNATHFEGFAAPRGGNVQEDDDIMNFIS